MSNMLDWATKEVELAVKRESNADDGDEEGFDYAKGCYESALKAYASLCEDGHSGMSFGIATNILHRLINHRPLTPIEDKDEYWEPISDYSDGSKLYQNRRLSSLFKTVFPDGSIEYDDVSAYECMDVDDTIPYHGGGSGKIFRHYCPIEFPYYPPTKPYRIMTETVLSDPKNGDWDARAYFKIVAPDGKEIPINRYFGETENGWQEIDYYEFFNRKMMEKDRKKAEGNDRQE